jgi:hypothetical protein
MDRRGQETKGANSEPPRDGDLATTGHLSSVPRTKPVDDLTQSADRRKVDERITQISHAHVKEVDRCTNTDRYHKHVKTVSS